MVSFDLTGKTALVTGGNGGLGLDMAGALAGAGASLAIVARNKEKLQRARESLIAETGARVEVYSCDVTDLASIRGTVAQVLTDFGGLDILLNNAGALSLSEGPEAHTEAQWDLVMDVDLKGVFFMAQEVYNQWMKEHGGRIINIASVAGRRASVNTVSYNVAKAGVIHLTNCLALAWAKDGVYVNAISPGHIQLGMGENTPADRVAAFSQKVPQARLGGHDDLNGALLFLASDACRYCQGQNIICDGGLILPLG